MMKFNVVQADMKDQAVDCLVIDHFEGEDIPKRAGQWLDEALGGALQALLAGGDFSGKAGTTALLYTNGRVSAPRVLVVGLGKPGKFDNRAARTAAATAGRALAQMKGVKSFASVVLGAGEGPLTPWQTAQAFAEGLVLSFYQPPRYAREAADARPATCVVVDFHGERLADFKQGIADGQVIAEGANMARDLSNEPPNVLSPVEMATRAKAMAKRTGLRCTVLGESEMAAEKMNILLAVSRGSANEAQLVILEHRPGKMKNAPPLVLVGKGITFDTGGISIKGSERMEEMKHDMSGAAAVIGAMEAIARLDLPQRVIGVAACVENMPDGNAFRPGDILTGMTGKTTEILSTDAEGRLILADALAYVKRFEPAAVVDLATLTGAIGIALGSQAAGLFYNSEELKDALLHASDRSGERLWPMPMYEEYMEYIKGDMAEVKNSGGRGGGVATSAKFIEHFIEGYPWAHLDIASTAWTSANKDVVNPKGATGYGVRLLVELARAFDAAAIPAVDEGEDAK
jgi:leucyl aminopeptidase